MRTLVTGGAGFLGAALVDRLLAEGHTVDVVDDLSTGSLAGLAPARAAGGRALSFHQLDIRLPGLEALVERRRPEVVFHLAAAPAADGSFADPAADADTDLVGAIRLLEACRRHGVTKVVFTAGAAMYGRLDPRDLPARESRATSGTASSPRGAAHRGVVEYLQVYRERYALEFTGLILANVYGPGRNPRRRPGVVGTWARQLVDGEACTVDGDGQQSRDFVFVDDTVDALARAATRGGGLLINVGTGTETSIGELYATMAAAAGRADPPPRRGPSRPGDPRRLALSPSRAGIHLGWKPWTSVREGVEATLAWWREQPQRNRSSR